MQVNSSRQIGVKPEKQKGQLMSSKRLDQFLADAMDITRKEAKAMLRQGRVKIEPAPGTVKPETKINDSSTVTVDGQIVSEPEEHVYYLLNKPAGYVSATEDSRDHTVLELLPPQKRRKLFPVGRLDKDTTGLLLLTDDGALAHELLSPEKHVDKTYEAAVRGIMTDEDIKAFAEGIDIGEEKPTLPAKLEILSSCEEGCRIRLTIQEGKFHQVKRMVSAVGKEVISLKRISMGKLKLPEGLAEGQYMKIQL